MNKLLAVAAVALAVALPAGASFADDLDNTSTAFAAPAAADPLFDLGVDVTGVTRTPAAVQGYLASLAPVTRQVVLAACENYMANPASAQDRETIAFCSVAVGG